jgi:hypothetical protein
MRESCGVIDETSEFKIVNALEVSNGTAGTATKAVGIVPPLPRRSICEENEALNWWAWREIVPPATVVTGALQIMYLEQSMHSQL